VKWLIERTYLVLSAVRKLLGGTNPFRYAREYARGRGMSWSHDIRDWVGGYPYESVNSEELIRYVERRGFTLERSFDTVPGTGLFGTGCGEWTFRRTR
jgi:2-polyprenyl-6-hydroxyphenyl methylase/3-demethylubiquinone-9 3-methyltransferase